MAIAAAVLAEAVRDDDHPAGVGPGPVPAPEATCPSAAGDRHVAGHGLGGRRACVGSSLNPAVRQVQVQCRSEVIVDPLAGQAEGAGRGRGSRRASGPRAARPRTGPRGRRTRRRRRSRRGGRRSSSRRRPGQVADESVPPGATRRAISARAGAGSGMWWTIELETTASNRPPGEGERLGVAPGEPDPVGQARLGDVPPGQVEHRRGQVDAEDPRRRVGPAERDRDPGRAGADVEDLAAPARAVGGEEVGDEPGVDRRSGPSRRSRAPPRACPSPRVRARGGAWRSVHRRSGSAPSSRSATGLSGRGVEAGRGCRRSGRLRFSSYSRARQY